MRSKTVCGVLWLAAAGAWAQSAESTPPSGTGVDAGRVAFAAGNARLKRGGEGHQPLAQGMVLMAGDLVDTGAGGRAQLVLADGSRVALQADSRVSLGHGASAVLGFGAGSLRVVSPAPGTPLQLRTTRGTLRVRGPGFSAVYNADGSVSIASEREPVEVCTAAGCVTAADDNVLVRAEDRLPTHTNARARWR